MLRVRSRIFKWTTMPIKTLSLLAHQPPFYFEIFIFNNMSDFILLAANLNFCQRFLHITDTCLRKSTITQNYYFLIFI